MTNSTNKNITFKQFIKVIFYTIMILFLFYTVYFFGNFFPIVGNKISDKITQKNIEKLYLGMKKKELIQIIGKPFDEYYKRGINYLVYSKTMMKMSAAEIEIYLYIKNGKLSGINMEYDDRNFYLCTNTKCPKIWNQKMYDMIVPVN